MGDFEMVEKIKKSIVIVGCGNVGSRHLQAVVKLPYELRIDVVEMSKKSQEIAESRLNEIKYNKNKIKCFWHKNIESLKGKADLVIVSTTSIGKVELISKLLDIGYSRFVIDKIVAQSDNEYNFLLNKMNQSNAKSWVNTARGYFEAYKKIKKYFENTGPIDMAVNAGNKGLGCVGIHFINLFSFLCDQYDIKLNGDFLYNKLLPNKRGDNLVEFAGTIIGLSPNGSSLTITFSPHSDLGQTINIMSKNKQILIDESNEKIYFLNGDTQNEIKFKNELQSVLTTKIVYDILEKDDSDLPTLKESSHVHHELFSIFNEHIKKLSGKDRELCPIT